MSDTMRTFVFALVLSLVCSTLLAVVSGHCQPRYEQNKLLERKTKTLSVLGIETPEEAKADRINGLYGENIVEKKDAEGSVLAYEYRDKDADKLVGVAFPIRGKGLWGPIGGMMALEGDRATIRGIRFFEHQETPGLGAEIEKDWFQDQFKGKKAIDERRARSSSAWPNPGRSRGRTKWTASQAPPSRARG